MRREIAIVGMVIGLVSASTVGAIQVNCKQVMQKLKMGRSVDDIMTTDPALTEADIKRCQEEAATQGQGGQNVGEKKAGEAAAPAK